MAGLERLFWYANFVATLALLLRLTQLKLIRVYPSLFWFWLAQALETALLLPVPLKSALYDNLYYLAQTVNLALAIWVVLELYRQALSLHPALMSFGRKSVLSLMALAAILAASGVLMDSAPPPGRSFVLHRFLATERTMDLMVLAFLLLISLFLLWFPVRVKRNVVVYILGFVGFYTTRAAGLLLVNRLPQDYLQPMSGFLLACSLGCLLIWLFGLRTESKDVMTITGTHAHGAGLDRLSLQLDEINAALSRLARN